MNIKFDKIYRNNKLILENINLELDRNKINCFISENGTGKSTLIESILGINKEYSGKVISEGSISGLLQYDIFIPRVKVKEELIAYKKFLKTDDELYNILIECFSLLELTNKYVSDLSGGERRRLSIAQTFMSKKKNLFLDEPLSGVDFQKRIKYREFFEWYSNKYNVLLFYSDHYITEIDSENYNYYYILNKNIYKIDDNVEDIQKYYTNIMKKEYDDLLN